MGDRIEMDMMCVYCKTKNMGIFFAPTCGFYTFECERCHKHNFIADTECIGFIAKKCEQATYQEVEDEFLNATNVEWKPAEIKRICEESFKNIKNMNKHTRRRGRKKSNE